MHRRVSVPPVRRLSRSGRSTPPIPRADHKAPRRERRARLGCGDALCRRGRVGRRRTEPRHAHSHSQDRDSRGTPRHAAALVRPLARVGISIYLSIQIVSVYLSLFLGMYLFIFIYISIHITFYLSVLISLSLSLYL